MSMDIKFEKQKNQYNRVNDLYINKSYTIEKACEKVGICKQTYYTIKKKMENNQKGGSSKKSISDDKIEYSKRNNSPNNELKSHKSKIKSNVRNIFDVLDSEIQKTGITV